MSPRSLLRPQAVFAAAPSLVAACPTEGSCPANTPSPLNEFFP